MTSRDYQAQYGSRQGASKAPGVPQEPPKPARQPDTAAAADGARRRQPESELQIACVTWFRLQYPDLARLLWAIPNGGRRGKVEAARFKREGVVSGAPDLLLAVATNRAPALFLELKAGRNKTSPAQRQMLIDLQGQGYGVCIVYALAQFQADVRQHLGY